MTRGLIRLLAGEMKKLRQAGLYTAERIPETSTAALADFTGYDYLGLSKDTGIRDAVISAVKEHGHGLSDSRPFSGTRTAHRALEQAIAKLLNQPGAIVFGSGYLANIGLYSALFDNRDSMFCDAWIHPSSAEGVRLSGARAVPYDNHDVEDLADKLKRSRAARFRAIVTDGVFAFSGKIAPLQELCDLAERYEAIVIVDDTLGVGVLGASGGGACEIRKVQKRVNVITGSFSKILGGAAGGYVAGDKEIIEWLRQKATPYLFSGALPPASIGAARHAVDLVTEGSVPRDALFERVDKMCKGLGDIGFDVLGGEHPTILAKVGDVVTLQRFVNQLLEAGVRVQGLCYPVVPEREARIRLQISALHTHKQLDHALEAFESTGRALEILS